MLRDTGMPDYVPSPRRVAALLRRAHVRHSPHGFSLRPQVTYAGRCGRCSGDLVREDDGLKCVQCGAVTYGRLRLSA